jgi:hypothetical protein
MGTGAGASHERVFKVLFHSQGQVYEIYARAVSHGSILGFVEVEELLFESTGKLVVDPAEERLRAEFAGVRRTYLPMHAVIRIDEVEKAGTARIAPSDRPAGVVTPFPVPVPSAGDKAPGK